MTALNPGDRVRPNKGVYQGLPGTVVLCWVSFPWYSVDLDQGQKVRGTAADFDLLDPWDDGKSEVDPEGAV